MEMERINDNLIKVIVAHDDLMDRGINFLDLVTGKENVEEFFYEILDDIDITKEFGDASAVNFQIVPGNDEISLYISGNNAENPEPVEDIAAQIFHSAFKEEYIKELLEGDHGYELEDFAIDPDAIHPMDLINPVHEVLEDDEDEEDVRAKVPFLKKYNVVRFPDLETFIQLSYSLHAPNFFGRLYEMEDSYYLILERLFETDDDKVCQHFIRKVLDFGELMDFTEEYLMEHGHFIYEGNPLGFFEQNF